MSNTSSKLSPSFTDPANWSLGLCLGILASALAGKPGLTGIFPATTIALGGLGAGAAGLLLLWRGRSALTREVLLILALLGWSWASVHQALCPFKAKEFFGAVLSFASVFLLSFLGTNTPRRWRWFAAALAGLISLSNLYALHSYTQQVEPLRGNFTNSDCYSLLCLIGFYLCLAGGLEADSVRHYLLRLSAIIPAASLILTGSRSGLLGLGVGYLAFIFVLSASRDPNKRRSALKLLILPLLAGLLLVASGSSSRMTEKFTALSTGSDPVAIKTRLDVARYGWKTAARYPLFGCGLACFPEAFQEDRPALMSGEDYMNVAHNDYIQWAVEIGPAGLALWMALLLSLLHRCWFSFKAPTTWVSGQLAILTGSATYMLFNPACPVPSLLLWLGATFGMSASLFWLRQDRQNEPPTRLAIAPISLLLCLTGVWVGSQAYNLYLAQKLDSQAVALEKVLDWEGAISALKRADQISADNPQRLLEIARLKNRMALVTREQHFKTEGLTFLKKALAASPRNLPALLGIASYYEDSGEPEQARIYLDTALKYAAYSPHVRRGLVRNLIFAGQVKEAASQLVELKNTGVPIDDSALAELIYFMEKNSPKEGLAYLTPMQSSRAIEIGLTAVRRHPTDQATCSRILQALNQSWPNDINIKLALVDCSPSEVTQLALLNELRHSPNIGEDPKFELSVWQKWTTLCLKRKKYSVLQPELEDYVLRHQRQNWARVALSQIHVIKGRRLEARSVLRNGIPHDEDGTLRVLLGDLCANQKLPDLARSYYQDALPVYKDGAALQKKIAALPRSGGMDSLPGEDEEESPLPKPDK